jgi:hypothetical protein
MGFLNLMYRNCCRIIVKLSKGKRILGRRPVLTKIVALPLAGLCIPSVGGASISALKITNIDRKLLVDDLLSGYSPFSSSGELVVLAGRPAKGETVYAMNIVANTVIKSRLPVALFYPGMSKHRILEELRDSLSSVKVQINRGIHLLNQKYLDSSQISELISKAPIFIENHPNLSLNDLKDKSRRLKQENNIQLILVNHLQLIRVEQGNQSRDEEGTEICRELHALATELRIPVIVIYHLNRNSRIANARHKRLMVFYDLKMMGKCLAIGKNSFKSGESLDTFMCLYRGGVS